MVDLKKMKKAKATGGGRKRDFDPSDLIGYTPRDGKKEDESGTLSFESIEHITADAGLLLLDDGQKMWIPKSQIIDAAPGSVTVTQWWADENGVELE